VKLLLRVAESVALFVSIGAGIAVVVFVALGLAQSDLVRESSVAGVSVVICVVVATIATWFLLWLRGRRVQLIRPLASNPEMFLYVVLDSDRSNLALARRKVKDIDLSLVM